MLIMICRLRVRAGTDGNGCVRISIWSSRVRFKQSPKTRARHRADEGISIIEEGVTMSVFTPTELSYLQGQRLGRIATVGPNGQPHVVPVGFRYNPDEDTIDVGGHDFSKRKKFRDVQSNPRVAIVIDDVVSVNPWTVRGIEIRGEAEILMTGGKEIGPGVDSEIFRIKPKRIVSWGIDGQWSHSARSTPPS
jgi:pyridoxamine 5'-phosphate oxidase family protein